MKVKNKILPALDGLLYLNWFAHGGVDAQVKEVVDKFNAGGGKIDVCPDWASPKELADAALEILRENIVYGFNGLNTFESSGYDPSNEQWVPIAAVIDYWEEDECKHLSLKSVTKCMTPEFHIVFHDQGNEYAGATLRRASEGETIIERTINEMELSFDRPFIVLFGEETREATKETIAMQAALINL